MNLDSPLWFVGACLVVAWHTLWLLNWRAEARLRLRQWGEYERASERRHREFMDALNAARDTHPMTREKAGE